jgi:rhodanese-related sulfurtransferase
MMMDSEHPDWQAFLERLEGPEGCDFKKDAKGKITWLCKSGNDKTFAKKILTDMGLNEFEIEESCEWFEDNGGYCDCEILFNCDKR